MRLLERLPHRSPRVPDSPAELAMQELGEQLEREKAARLLAKFRQVDPAQEPPLIFLDGLDEVVAALNTPGSDAPEL